MSSLQYLKVAVYFLILTELMRFSVKVLCCAVFKFLGKDLMDFGIRSGKSLILVMPKEPKVNSRTTKILSCRRFIRSQYAKSFNIKPFSDFSREFFATAVNFLFSNSNQNKIKQNDAPSKTHIMWWIKIYLQVKLPMNEDERGDTIRGIPKLRLLVVLEYDHGVPWESPSLSSCHSLFQNPSNLYPKTWKLHNTKL